MVIKAFLFGKQIDGLSGVIRDLDHMELALQSCGVESDNIYRDRDIEKESFNTNVGRIVDAFATFVRKVSDEDFAIIYFSGHGKNVDGKLAFKTSKNRDNYLHFSQLLPSIKLLRANKILIILDCCYSGIAYKEMSNYGGSNYLLLTSCSNDEEKSFELSKEEGSVFTYHLTNLISEIMNDNEIIDIRKLYEKLVSVIKERNQGEEKEFPLPILFGHVGKDFVLGEITQDNDKLKNIELYRKVDDLGLIDIALNRDDISNENIATDIEELINKLDKGSEFFIVARSLERWIKKPKGNEKYIDILAKKIVENKIKCTLVLPDNDTDSQVKSLVLSDPSQSVQSELWQKLTLRIKNHIDSNLNDDVLDNGYIEVYTIPAYVPSTFSMIKTKKGVSYCSLEVGIGVALDKGERVYLYFEDIESKPNIYSTLAKIYKNVISERKPKLKFPDHKNLNYEDKKKLDQYYDSMTKIKSIDCDKRMLVNDWYKDDEKRNGNVVCIATSDFESYIGGSELNKLIENIQNVMKEVLENCDASVSLFDLDNIYIPVYYYNSKFTSKKEYVEIDINEKEEIISLIREFSPLTLKFNRIGIDKYGFIYLMGYQEECYKEINKSSNSISNLRDDLFRLIKVDYAHFNSRRPRMIYCKIGIIEDDVGSDVLDYLNPILNSIDNFETPKSYKNINFKHVIVEIDTLRIIKLVGNIIENKLIDLENNILLKNDLIEKDTHKEYQVLSTGKWLDKDNNVTDLVKNIKFNKFKPVTVQLCLSLDCPYKCPICSYGKVKSEIKKKSCVTSMSENDLIEIIRKLNEAKTKGIIFTGGGEPLTNEAIIAGVRKAKEKEMGVGIFTNGYCLDFENNGEKYYNIFCKGNFDEDGETKNFDPDFIRISINAGKSKEYSLIHGCNLDAYDKVIRNITNLAKAKDENNSECNIDIGVIITPLNINNLIDISMDIKKISMKYPKTINNISFRPAIKYENGCQDDNFTKSFLKKLVETYGEQSEEYLEFEKFFEGAQFSKSLFNKAKDIINKDIKPILENPLNNSIMVGLPESRFEDATSKNNRKYSKCLTNCLVPFIAPDTSVYSCVERAFEENLLVGKIKKSEGNYSSLYSITKKFNPSIDIEKCPPVCLLHETNVTFNKIEEKLKKDKTRTNHDIDIAAKYFNKYIKKDLGVATKFL